ncbi:AAEL006804-PA [Aedes aegypti]|uniref:AAEL006804-PA n=2 Tax=Aedes aegypti TaxID=7159 RepID=Q174S9_AEDAE|nr:AAEL006804-PA [Aedes aegypti]
MAAAVLVAVLLFCRYVAKKYQYFLTKPVPCVKPTFLLGSSGPTIFRKVDVATHFKKIYDVFPQAPVIGFYDFTTPMYLLRDPEMIKKVSIKDFDYFTDHVPMMPTDAEKEHNPDTLFGNTLLSLRGQKWRDMRSTLSPAFTGSKMRHMFELVAECGRSLVEHFKAEAAAGRTMEHEMKETFSKVGSDLIATLAFGIKVDSLREPENVFYANGKKMLNLKSLATFVKFLLITFVPRLMRWLKVDVLNGQSAAYFKRIILDNMEQREAHKILRNDMIQILMEVRKGTLQHQKEEKDTKDAGFATVEESQVGKSSHSRVWTENELVAQCLLFFLAGLDTISTCMTFLTYELTVDPDIQQRLYEEITETDKSLNGKPLSYDVLQRMQYMDMIVSETLRKWPPGVISNRYCNKNYLYDDGRGTQFVIEKGQVILIPSYCIQRDPRYFPDPDRFDPERFNEANRAQINTCAYIPFGVGPRNCIGSRLALMEVKCMVYYLLKDFELIATEKTQIPVSIARDSFGLHPEKGVWIEFKPRSSQDS